MQGPGAKARIAVQTDQVCQGSRPSADSLDQHYAWLRMNGLNIDDTSLMAVSAATLYLAIVLSTSSGSERVVLLMKSLLVVSLLARVS